MNDYILPEVVMSKAMLNSPLEFTYIPAPILTSMNSTAMTLSIRPFPSIYITCKEPINPKSMPKTLPVLAPISASPCPSFNPIAIILAINPIPFKPATQIIVINSTSTRFSLMKLAFIDIPITISLNITT